VTQIRIAISHYQFETIHPFQDGNGRIGRLLITLYLVSHKLLHKPSLYLSDYFEKNKGAYYDALTRVRASHDLAHWIKMFLVAVIATAEKGKKTFQDIIALQHKLDQKIVCMGRGAKNAHLLLNVLYKNPVINTSEVMRELGTSQVTADKLIKRFQEADILEEITGYKRNRRFQFKGYFELFMR
jgi:Fic family protein